VYSQTTQQISNETHFYTRKINTSVYNLTGFRTTPGPGEKTKPMVTWFSQLSVLSHLAPVACFCLDWCNLIYQTRGVFTDLRVKSNSRLLWFKQENSRYFVIKLKDRSEPIVTGAYTFSRAWRKATVVYHLLGKSGWSTVVVNRTRQIPNGNFHGDVLVPFPRLFSGR